MRVSGHFARGCAAAVGVVSAFATERSDASLTFDLVATSVKKAGTGSLVAVSDPKHVVVAAGDIVRLRLYGTVSGTDPSKSQTLHSASGSLLSSNGGIRGDWQRTRISNNATNTNTAAHLSSPWNQVASSVGLAQDLDGDGDADLGSNVAGVSDNFVAYRSNETTGPRSNFQSGDQVFNVFDVPPETVGATTKYTLSAQIDFRVTSTLDATPTQLNWRLRPGESSLWFEDATEDAADISVEQDGSQIKYSYSGGSTGIVQLVGPPVVLSVPEPAMGVAGAALTLFVGRLARRRRYQDRSRRSAVDY